MANDNSIEDMMSTIMKSKNRDDMTDEERAFDEVSDEAEAVTKYRVDARKAVSEKARQIFSSIADEEVSHIAEDLEVAKDANEDVGGLLEEGKEETEEDKVEKAIRVSGRPEDRMSDKEVWNQIVDLIGERANNAPPDLKYKLLNAVRGLPGGGGFARHDKYPTSVYGKGNAYHVPFRSKNVPTGKPDLRSLDIGENAAKREMPMETERSLPRPSFRRDNAYRPGDIDRDITAAIRAFGADIRRIRIDNGLIDGDDGTRHTEADGDYDLSTARTYSLNGYSDEQLDGRTDGLDDKGVADFKKNLKDAHDKAFSDFMRRIMIIADRYSKGRYKQQISDNVNGLTNKERDFNNAKSDGKDTFFTPNFIRQRREAAADPNAEEAPNYADLFADDTWFMPTIVTNQMAYDDIVGVLKQEGMSDEDIKKLDKEQLDEIKLQYADRLREFSPSNIYNTAYYYDQDRLLNAMYDVVSRILKRPDIFPIFSEPFLDNGATYVNDTDLTKRLKEVRTNILQNINKAGTMNSLADMNSWHDDYAMTLFDPDRKHDENYETSLTTKGDNGSSRPMTPDEIIDAISFTDDNKGLMKFVKEDKGRKEADSHFVNASNIDPMNPVTNENYWKPTIGSFVGDGMSSGKSLIDDIKEFYSYYSDFANRLYTIIDRIDDEDVQDKFRNFAGSQLNRVIDLGREELLEKHKGSNQDTEAILYYFDMMSGLDEKENLIWEFEDEHGNHKTAPVGAENFPKYMFSRYNLSSAVNRAEMSSTDALISGIDKIRDLVKQMTVITDKDTKEQVPNVKDGLSKESVKLLNLLTKDSPWETDPIRGVKRIRPEIFNKFYNTKADESGDTYLTVMLDRISADMNIPESIQKRAFELSEEAKKGQGDEVLNTITTSHDNTDLNISRMLSNEARNAYMGEYSNLINFVTSADENGNSLMSALNGILANPEPLNNASDILGKLTSGLTKMSNYVKSKTKGGRKDMDTRSDDAGSQVWYDPDVLALTEGDEPTEPNRYGNDMMEALSGVLADYSYENTGNKGPDEENFDESSLKKVPTSSTKPSAINNEELDDFIELFKKAKETSDPFLRQLLDQRVENLSTQYDRDIKDIEDYDRRILNGGKADDDVRIEKLRSDLLDQNWTNPYTGEVVVKPKGYEAKNFKNMADSEREEAIDGTTQYKKMPSYASQYGGSVGEGGIPKEYALNGLNPKLFTKTVDSNGTVSYAVNKDGPFAGDQDFQKALYSYAQGESKGREDLMISAFNAINKLMTDKGYHSTGLAPDMYRYFSAIANGGDASGINVADEDVIRTMRRLSKPLQTVTTREQSKKESLDAINKFIDDIASTSNIEITGEVKNDLINGLTKKNILNEDGTISYWDPYRDGNGVLSAAKPKLVDMDYEDLVHMPFALDKWRASVTNPDGSYNIRSIDDIPQMADIRSMNDAEGKPKQLYELMTDENAVEGEPSSYLSKKGDAVTLSISAMMERNMKNNFKR